MSQNPTLSDVIEASLEQRLESVFTAAPGIVVDYDPAGRTATVQCTIRDVQDTETGGEIAVPIPPLPRVPVVFMGSGDFEIVFPLAKGDGVLLVWSHASIANWKSAADGSLSDPQHDSRFHVGDCFCIPGLRTKAPSNVPRDDSSLVIRGDSIKLGGADASDPVVRKSDLAAFIGEYNSHTHHVATAPGESVVPTVISGTPICSATVRTT